MSEKKIKEKNEKGKVNPMMILLVLMFVLIVGLGAGLGYLILNQKSPASTKPTTVVVNALELPPLTYPVTKDFIVNLTDKEADRYVKLNITLAFTGTKLQAELLTIDSFIRDSVISILREKKASDFTAKGTEELKKQFMTRINPYLKTGKISEIYFNDIFVKN